MKKVITIFIILIVTTVGVMGAMGLKKNVVEPEAAQTNFVSQNKSDVGTWD